MAVGTLRHRRFAPRRHAFGYRVFHLLVDLDDLARLDREVRGFGYNRPAVATIHDRDHLGPSEVPIRTKLTRWLARQGHALPAGPVLLHTSPRVLGHVFNPVSWFYCFEPSGRLTLVVAEVNNTFGETYGYVLDRLHWTGVHRVEARRAKRFHVSPFLPIDGLDYRFVFRPPGTGSVPAGVRIAVHMEIERGGERWFDATLAERLAPLTTRTLWSALARTPLVTLKTVAAIHFEALRLAAKRVPFHRKPPPPDPQLHGLDADPPAPLTPPAPTDVSAPTLESSR